MQGQSLPLSLASTRLTMLLTASLNFSSSVKMGMLSPTTLSTRLSPIACSDIVCQQSAVLPLLKREKQRICHSHQGVMSRPDLDLPVACSVTLGRADAVSCPLLIRDPSCCHCSTSCPSSSAQAACVPKLLYFCLARFLAFGDNHQGAPIIFLVHCAILPLRRTCAGAMLHCHASHGI